MVPYVDLKQLTSLIIRELKNLKGNDRLDISNIKNGENLAIAAAKPKIDMNDMRWHGSGGGTPAGSNTQIQFNDSGNFGADQGLTYITTNGIPSIVIGAGSSNDQGQILSPDGSGNSQGIDIVIEPGQGAGSGAGGFVVIDGGTGNLTGNGGDVQITGGNATGSGHQGDVLIGGRYLIIPTEIGVPSGSPTLGSMIFDSNTNRLYIYNGGWKSVLLS